MKIIRAITHEIEHVEKSFQVVTYSTIVLDTYNIIIMTSPCIGDDDKTKFQKLLNSEINQNGGI